MIVQANEYLGQLCVYFLNNFLFSLDQIISAKFPVDFCHMAGYDVHPEFFPRQDICMIVCRVDLLSSVVKWAHIQ